MAEKPKRAGSPPSAIEETDGDQAVTVGMNANLLIGCGHARVVSRGPEGLLQSVHASLSSSKSVYEGGVSQHGSWTRNLQEDYGALWRTNLG